MDSSKQTRRSLLKLGGSVLASSVIAGCSDDSPEQNKTDRPVDLAGNVSSKGTTQEIPNLNESDSDDNELEDLPEDVGDEGEQDTEEAPNVRYLHGISGSTRPPDTEGLKRMEYSWSAFGDQWDYTQEIPRRLAEYYQEKDGTLGYKRYVSDTFGQPIIEGLAAEFERLGNEYGWTDRKVVDLVTAFVQQLKYTKDDVYAGIEQYSQYPVETLLRPGGDCEDTAILLAAILREMGYGCILLGLFDANHMALGVKGEPSIQGHYYTYNGNRYYYVETTGEGYQIGEIPEGYQNETAEFIKTEKTPTVVYDYETKAAGNGEIDVTATISNPSDVPAPSPEFTAQFTYDDILVDDSQSQQVGNGYFFTGTDVVTVTLEPSANKELRLDTRVTSGDTLYSKDKSRAISPP